MGIDITEIAQKVLDNNTNAANVFRKMYDLHYNPNPLDVPFEYIDENGNKITTNIPNVANFRKKIWDDVGGALGKISFTDPDGKPHIQNISIISENLIKNSFMVKSDDDATLPDGYIKYGGLNVETVHPYTKAFEGPYTSEKPDTAVDDPELATQDNPYWYGVYNKGPRIYRGGLADGWNNFGTGNILKITYASDGTRPTGFTSIFFPFNKPAIGDYFYFECYIKVIKGKCGFGIDSGYNGYPRGYIQGPTSNTDYPQGWKKISAIVGTSQNVLKNSSFCFGIDTTLDFEGYLALPAIYQIMTDSYKVRTLQN